MIAAAIHPSVPAVTLEEVVVVIILVQDTQEARGGAEGSRTPTVAAAPTL